MFYIFFINNQALLHHLNYFNSVIPLIPKRIDLGMTVIKMFYYLIFKASQYDLLF